MPKKYVRDIGDGDEAVMKTLQHMKRLARRDAKTPDVGVLAEKIEREAAEHKDPARYRIELIKGAFTWVVDNITYQYDHEHVLEHHDTDEPKNTEFLIAPVHLVGIGRGDCDDMSTMLASLLLRLGFKVKFKVIAHRRHAYTHVYVEVLAPTDKGERWIPMDPVMGMKGFANEKPDIIRKTTFNV